MWAFFSVLLVAVAAAILLLLRRYAAGSVPLVVKATTTYAWLVAFIVVVRALVRTLAVRRDDADRFRISRCCPPLLTFSHLPTTQHPLQQQQSQQPLIAPPLCPPSHPNPTPPTTHPIPGPGPNGRVLHPHEASRQPRHRRDVAGLLLVDAGSNLAGAAFFSGVCRRGRLHRGSALLDVIKGQHPWLNPWSFGALSGRWLSVRMQDTAAAVKPSRPPTPPPLHTHTQTRDTQLAPRRAPTPHTRPQENGILYGVAGAAGVVGLICIFAVEKTLTLKDLIALGMGLSNTFALSAGLLLMGYGLMEIPRESWKSGPEQLLKWCAHRCGPAGGGRAGSRLAGRRGLLMGCGVTHERLRGGVEVRSACILQLQPLEASPRPTNPHPTNPHPTNPHPTKPHPQQTHTPMQPHPATGPAALPARSSRPPLSWRRWSPSSAPTSARCPGGTRCGPTWT